MKTATDTKVITKPDDLFLIVAKHRIGSDLLLFRGQNIDEPLLPRFAREAKRCGLHEPTRVEKEMLSAFKKRSIPFLESSPPNSIWDWLFVAQHHGLPTRLLDWTSNAFVALWFAVDRPVPKKSKSGTFWVLQPNNRDILPLTDNVALEALKRTRVLQPPHISKRISAQGAWFTAHKYIEDKNRFVPLDRNKGYKGKLTKYSIPLESFDHIRTALGWIGLSQSSLFPDLDNICDDLREQYLHS